MVRYNLADNLFSASFSTSFIPTLNGEQIQPKTEEETLADFVRGSKFPLTDVYKNSETGELMIQYALAGYCKEELKVKTEDSTIIIEKVDIYKHDGTWVTLQQSIKNSKFMIKTPIPTKYDLSLLKVSFKNGILKIIIPLAEDKKPTEIKIE